MSRPFLAKLSVLLFLAVSIAPATAADSRLLSSQPVVNWTGLYSSIGVGVSRAEFEQSGISADANDPTYILSGGYLHDFGGLVLGAQFDLEFGEKSAQFAGSGLSTRFETNITLEAAARAGFAINRFLVTGHVGYSWIETTQSGATLAGPFSNSASDTGIVYGAAIDYAFTDRIFVGAEYSRKRYEDLEATGADLEFDTVSARVGFRF